LEILAHRLLPIRAVMGQNLHPTRLTNISKISPNLQNLEQSRFRVLLPPK
jgi:hypothetical protein